MGPINEEKKFRVDEKNNKKQFKKLRKRIMTETLGLFNIK